MDEYSIETLESLVGNSRCYQDSSAFRRSLQYIKSTQIDLYKTLLYIECKEAGFIAE